MKFSENSTVEDALKKSKAAIKILRKYNLYCPNCKGKKRGYPKKSSLEQRT
jgi:hypothetical protein